MHSIRRSTQLIVIQPTSLCNMNCTYCYLGNRSRSNFMSRSVLEAVGRNVCRSKLINPLVEVSFHSGEPLLAGTDWFNEAIDTFAASWPSHISATYSVQTNAILINKTWETLFDAHRIPVSVSLDGPERLNDLDRRNWAGRGTFERVGPGYSG
jgi:uncharacterized protein